MNAGVAVDRVGDDVVEEASRVDGRVELLAIVGVGRVLVASVGQTNLCAVDKAAALRMIAAGG